MKHESSIKTKAVSLKDLQSPNSWNFLLVKQFYTASFICICVWKRMNRWMYEYLSAFFSIVPHFGHIRFNLQYIPLSLTCSQNIIARILSRSFRVLRWHDKDVEWSKISCVQLLLSSRCHNKCNLIPAFFMLFTSVQSFSQLGEFETLQDGLKIYGRCATMVNANREKKQQQ